MAEERVQRQLAATFAVDVVGYSRLMAAYETGTLARLKAIRKELVDPIRSIDRLSYRRGGRMTCTRLTRIVLVTLGVLAAPLTAEAQQTAKIARIGVLWPGGAATLAVRMETFRQGLRDRGFVEGRNVTLEFRPADGRTERLPQLAAELVRLDLDVITPAGGSRPPHQKQTLSCPQYRAWKRVCF